jgi:hypothetical protein
MFRLKESTMVTTVSSHTVQFSVDYPDSQLDRFSSFFRIIAIIPITVVLWLVQGTDWGSDYGSEHAWLGGVLFLAPLAMILFRQKYPKWWFDWNVALLKFENRVLAYLFLLRDEYPSADEEQAVHLDIPYPDAKNQLNRWLPIFKWLFAIPHYIVLVFLYIVLVIAVIIAWFAILFTGLYPKGLFDYVVGTMRWSNRVWGYAFLLVTDKYPPFRFSP